MCWDLENDAFMGLKSLKASKHCSFFDLLCCVDLRLEVRQMRSKVLHKQRFPFTFWPKTMLDHDHRQIQAVTGHHTIFHTRNWFAWTVRAKLRVCPKISRPTANRDFSFGACSMFKRFYTRSLLLRHAHILRCEVATLGLGVGRISEVSDIPQANSHKLSPAALMGSWLSRVITWVWNLVLIK